MNRRVLQLCCAVVILLSGCSLNGVSRPADFNARYEWRAGALPPPRGYKYTIQIGPAPQGNMILRTYGVKNAPVWTESFRVQTADLDKLYATMAAHGLFTRNWQQMTNSPTGGSTQLLAATANGVRYSIPAHPASGEERAAAQKIYAAMEALVPVAVRGRLEVQRKQWADKFR